MSRENYDACASEKELLVIPGATHAMSYYYDTPAYTKAVTDFLKKAHENQNSNRLLQAGPHHMHRARCRSVFISIAQAAKGEWS